MICQQMTAASSRITELGRNVLAVKAFAMCKTEQPSCFSCQIDILWAVPYFQNRGGLDFGANGYN